MAQKNKKKTQQDKVEQARAIAEKQALEDERKRKIRLVFTIILCVFLVFAFCFPAITTLF